MELKFDLFLYYTAWICWHFNFAINVWDHKLLWYFIYKLWTLYNFCHAGCWHILLWIKNKTCCQRPVERLLESVLISIDPAGHGPTRRWQQRPQTMTAHYGHTLIHAVQGLWVAYCTNVMLKNNTFFWRWSFMHPFFKGYNPSLWYLSLISRQFSLASDQIIC